MTKPEVIEQIEALFPTGFSLQLAPTRPSVLDGLMAVKVGKSKYALDEEGQLMGLNLAGAKLNNERWQAMLKLLEEHSVNLHALNLCDNELTGRFDFPMSLKDLQRLDVSGNKLTEFPPPFDDHALSKIYLDDNPLSYPPPEIVQQGSQGILDWFASFEDTKEKKAHFFKEIKLLIVGEGSSGKTSLLKQIKGLAFDEQESQTHGVNVESLEMGALKMFQAFDAVKDVRLHVWDFGGQEIMHASHQFFLTRRSIYVFVIDSRADHKKEYWLRHIQKFGGDSPAIVVINKMDENANYSLEESSLNGKYPFIGNRFVKLSCKTKQGQTNFAETLAGLIPKTAFFSNPISASWLKIKNQLVAETATKQYITQKRFLEICSEQGEDTPSAQETLLNYLNALGVVLHFSDLAHKAFYVLDPHWVTIGVYKIINSPSIVNGVLAEQQLEHILNEEEQKKGEYDPNRDKKIIYEAQEQLYLLGIMKKFELLYEYKKGCYLIPNLLPKEPLVAKEFGEDEALRFIMVYDFLPPNLLSRFMIQMQDDIQEIDTLWRTGVWLSNNKFACEAKVTADMDQQTITIIVNGQERRKREYFSIVLHKLCLINDKFSNLKVTEKMPVPGHPEILYEYQELLALEEMNEDRLVIGRLKKAFSVSKDFLDKVSTKEQRQHHQKGNRLATHFDLYPPELKEDFEEIKQRTKAIDKKTDAILSRQELAQQYLDQLLLRTTKHRKSLEAIFQQIDDLKTEDRELERINDFLEKCLSHYFKQLPTESDTAQQWQATKEKLPYEANAKWKLKFKLPFLFGSLEKELAWDSKAAIKLFRKEFMALKTGEKNWKQLFIEEEEEM